MAPQNQRWAILSALYRTKGVSPQTLYDNELAEQLRIPWAQLRDDADYLSQRSFLTVTRVQRGSRVYSRVKLTAAGVDVVEGRVNDEAVPNPNAAARPFDVSIECLYQYVPTGVLDLYDADTMPLLRCKLANHTNKVARFSVKSSIEAFSFSRVDSVDVAAGGEGEVRQLPRLQADRAKELTEVQRAVIQAEVSCLQDGNEEPLYEQSFEIFLMARNVIRWAVPDPDSATGYRPLLEHIAAWVTPRALPVRQVLRAALDLTPADLVWGYPQAVDPEPVRQQVAALFQTLKDNWKLKYLDSVLSIGPQDGSVRQAIRLPADSIGEHAANCIDGVVLYASLLEAAGLEPVIVLLSGHAFVGWHVWQGLANDCEFLETTLIATGTFEEAFESANTRYKQLKQDGWFDRPAFDPNGFAALLDIVKLHEAGIHPMA